MRSFLFAVFCFTTVASLNLASAAPTPPAGGSVSADLEQAPLPRWREGGTPADDPHQSLKPRQLQWVGPQLKGLSGPPTSGVMAAAPEYAPVDGVMFCYGKGWNDVVTDCVVELTKNPSHDEIAYVLVSSASQQASATNAFTNAGADMAKVVFQIEPLDSIWLRDYGPHFVWQSGAQAITDSHYYPTRSKDNFVPTLSAEDIFECPSYPMGLYYSGGNYQPGPNRSGFVTSLVNQDNPGFSDEYLLELYHEYQGVDTLHIMPRLPSSVDGTGHIDMWMYLVDDNTVIVSKFKPGSNPTAIQITDDAAHYLGNLGFKVVRIPAWNVGSTHYTYTNAFRVNDRIFIPSYGSGKYTYKVDDRDAVLAWKAAAGPNVEIIEIDCYSIIPAAGAIHCIVMQVPRYSLPGPSAHVVAPDGGELLVSGTTTDLLWAASDDDAVTSVDLSYSTDGGLTFPNVISTGEVDDGHYAWSVPATLSTQTVVKVVAKDAALNTDEAVSETFVEVTNWPRTVYDFSTGAGVDRWCWGNQTQNWSMVDGIRYPSTASTPLTALSAGGYNAIATSDATGGDNDPNRYISAKPSSGQESTHIFEFTIAENPATIADIGVVWEGYGDQCLQMELYVWDDVAGNWGDGRGESGINQYLANFAGNRDENLTGHIRGGFDRYIDVSGKVTLLVYAERSSQESFHDYISVTVTHTGGAVNPFADLGNGLAGQFGQPYLQGSGPLSPGQPINVILSNALENAPGALVVGTAAISVPFEGGVLVPFPNLVLPLSTGPTGNLALPAIWPTGVPSGAQVYLQYWVPDAGGPEGYSATNALKVTAP